MKSVLIVDDEAEIVELLCMVLEDDDMTVCAAYDGEQALEIVRQEHPHLVLTDVMMPRLDGLELCRAISSDPETSSTAIILMTTAHRLDLSACDAQHVITKPFDINSVVGTVQRVLT